MERIPYRLGAVLPRVSRSETRRKRVGRAQPDPVPIPFRKATRFLKQSVPETEALRKRCAHSDLSGGKTCADYCGYEYGRKQDFIATISQLLSRAVECMSRERDRLARVIGQSGSEAVDSGIITSNYLIETRVFCFHSGFLAH